MTSNGVSVDYLSTGANRQTAVADWSRAGLVAFGADCNIALWHPTDGCSTGISRLLSGHKETVKAVAFLPQVENDAAAYLVSGSDDRTLVVWKAPKAPGGGGQAFEPVQTCSDHAGPINCISALRAAQDQQKWIVATGAADATVRIWCFENDRLHPLQTIQTSPKYFPLALSLSRLGAAGGDVFVLASAGTRDTVQILTAVATGGLETIHFSLQATLSGHEGWIRSLSFTRESGSPDSDVLLASASQDKYVRIWRIHQGRELPALVADGSDPSSDAFLPGRSPSNKAYWLKAAGSDFSVTFEALLLGHEDWIYSAKWFTQADGRLQLLSTSADNSLAIWEADPTSGIWVSMARLGEISREKGATTATGSTGGFWTGLWSPDGKSVACLGRTGSWRRWEYEEEQDSWRPCLAISGHTKAVTGISWAKSGSYLLSTSSDQTTRLHMQWKRRDGFKTWHEMSRPQIHGYDLNCIDSLGDFQFVSGADEKLMRVFSEPRAVAAMLSRLGDVPDPSLSLNLNLAAMPDAANMPVLGLSNKAIDTFDDDDDNDGQNTAPKTNSNSNSNSDRDAIDPASVVKKSYLDIHHPPLEETLSRHTLWPETEKLYGHGYEISCLASSHDGTLVASACKASSLNHAVIRLFETQSWTELKPPLAAHSLTATRVRFSPDDAYLLSVGRDRQWAIFSRSKLEERVSGPTAYELLQANPKGHSRMILDAAWAPSETPLFATAGRDKQVRIWRAGSHGDGDGDGDGDGKKIQFQQANACPCEAPVTAVDFLPRRVGGKYLLATGTEAGRVSLLLLSEDGFAVTEVPLGLSLPKAVLQLAWRPVREEGEVSRYELAVAGEDSSLRIYSFDGEMLR